MQITRLFFGRTFRSNEKREFGLGVDDSSWQGRAKIRFDGRSIAVTGYW